MTTHEVTNPYPEKLELWDYNTPSNTLDHLVSISPEMGEEFFIIQVQPKSKTAIAIDLLLKSLQMMQLPNNSFKVIRCQADPHAGTRGGSNSH